MKKCVQSWVSTDSHISQRSFAQYTHRYHSPLIRFVQRSHSADECNTVAKYAEKEALEEEDC